MRTRIPIASIVVLLLVTGVVVAANGYQIVRYVIANGGTHTEAGNYAMAHTIGQPVTGMSRKGGYALSAGFWAGGMGAVYEHDVFLPLVVRSS